MGAHIKRNFKPPLDYADVTLTEVSEELGITRQRTQQIEVKAINKLRKICKKLKMDEFLRD